MKRDFKGVWIPKEIWLSEDLTLQEKVFLVEINSLDNDKGCYASNKYFADFFGLSKTRVSLVIKSLEEKGYVSSRIIKKRGNKRILKTYLTKVKDPSLRNVKDPYLTKVKDHANNTSSNNTDINNKEKENTVKSKIFLTSFQKDIFNKFWFYLETKHPHSYKQYQKKKNRMETNWGETINWLMDNTKDTYSESEIYNAIKNATIDKFWCKQFRSINKLKQTDKEGTRYIAKFLDLGEQNKSEVDRYLEGV